MSGSPVAKVIHNFGRAERVDHAALARLVSRFLSPEQAAATAHSAEVETVDSRRLGGAWTLDRVWERLGIGAAIRRVAAGRRLDGDGVERVVFRVGRPAGVGAWLQAGSDRLGGAAGRDPGLRPVQRRPGYRAMDFLLESLTEIAGEVFASVARRGCQMVCVRGSPSLVGQPGSARLR